MNEHVRIVYLDEYHTHPITISASRFADIAPLVLEARVCRICALSYTDERPRVAENTCLPCYLGQQKDTYTFIGVGTPSQATQSQHTTYLFLDVKGMVSTSTTSSENAPKESVEQTLRYYGFPVPIEYVENGSQVALHDGNWHIRGNVQTHTALVIEYMKYAGDLRDIPFLVYKHGEAILLDKRRGKTRQLYQQAKRQYEAIPRRTIFYEPSVYEIVSDLASAEYNQSKKEYSQ